MGGADILNNVETSFWAVSLPHFRKNINVFTKLEVYFVMKKNVIALAVLSVIGFMGISTAQASTYSDASAVEVSANIVTPSTTTGQFTPAADSFNSNDIKSGVTIGTVTINSDVAPTGWWFSVPSDPLTASTTQMKLVNPVDQTWFAVKLPESWQFSTDNGGIMWLSSYNKQSVSFDLKADETSGYRLSAGKYSLVLDVGSYVS